ncbi:FeoA family protein [Pelagibaculum spongiae]|uniref:Ferrous iron transport protein A n=1 Tax=Pelagibaculum spongiae TaxID=2080658 RepID=A0A2V1GQS0_9GAMM|nr:FeoA family protein [Pelagibaculum spongiae]PVZ64350.1 ferrous iron transport protein A [Pelagibaculum spongiae]
MKLNQLSPGNQARVISLSKASPSYRKQLLSMGITPGAKISFVRTAPMGDPIQIEVRGTQVSLRLAEAGAIEVEQL